MLTWKDPIQVFMVLVMEKNPLLHGLSCAKWQTHSWRPWRGCSMNACLQMDKGLLAINMMNLVVKILMQDMTASEMVVVVVGGLVIMAGMEEELTGVVVTTMCILKMKNPMTLIMRRDLVIMRIPLQMMGCLVGAKIVASVLIMKIGSIIVVIIIGMIRTALLVSS